MKKWMAMLIILLSAANSWGWWDKSTHRILTKYAVKKYFDPIDVNFLEKELTTDGMTNKATMWLQRGSELEDAGSTIGFVTGSARSLNHFHDPTKPLSEAGLSDLPLPSKMSTVLWAQDPSAQSGATGGDWSWQKVRYHYYRHLTGSDKQSRDASLARELMGLGYQMHLIQDMSQPNHVRNDTHVDDGKGKKPKYGFETWAKNNDAKVAAILANNNSIVMNTASVDLASAYEGGLAPVARLYDSRNNLRVNTTVLPYMTYILPSTSFSQGLAEYTNSNFYSENSIFAAERHAVGNRYFFPYPKKTETDVQKFIDKNLPTIPLFDINKTYQNFRIGKTSTTGEALNCVAKPTKTTANYYRAFGEGRFFYGSFVADEECFEEQATKLLPRASGYSIAMLNYFFRGTLNIAATPGDITFRNIKITATNSTTGEAMGTGDVSLVIRYKMLSEISLGGGKYKLSKPSSDYSYKIATIANVNLATPQPLTFDFSNEPLPINFSDMTMQLVFRGKLGNEDGAVAVSKLEPITRIYSDFVLSLPPSGVYAKSSDNTPDATFNELRLTALSNIPGGLSGGTISLALEYRVADRNPFEALSGNTEPADGYAYVYRIGEKNGVNTLAQGVPTELVFNLSAAPLPVKATDVAVNVIYTDTATSKTVAVGYRDISEATPIDLFNNTDYACISNTWYAAGSPEAIAAADQAGNSNGIDDDTDTYRHDFTNIYLKLSSVNNPVRTSANTFDFLVPGPVKPATMQRMGFVLTDQTFKTSLLPNWVHVEYPKDSWIRTEAATLDSATAVRITSDADGVFTPPPMYNMRGKLMWGNAGSVYDNSKLPVSSICSWSALPVTISP